MKGGSKLTRKLIEQVCATIRKGNYRQTAFGAHNVLRRTAYEWIRTGNDLLDGKIPEDRITAHQRLCAELAQELEKAEAEAQSNIIADVLAPGTSPEVKLKFLSRRWNREFNNNPNAYRDVGTEDPANAMNVDARETLEALLKNLTGENA